MRISARAQDEYYLQDPLVFTNLSPEQLYKANKANNPVLNELIREDQRILRRMLKTLKEIEIYREIFEPITGVGPAIAGGIIALTVDITRFQRVTRYRNYCGLAPNKQGRFRHRRSGESLDYSPGLRAKYYQIFADMALKFKAARIG